MKIYKINKHYFDIIDTEDKAYWLGFLWCDGYVIKRDKYYNNCRKIEYNIKLSLSPQDENHLKKFKKCIDSNHPIHTYKCNGFSGIGETVEKRVFITNKHMGEMLQKKYQLIPHREKCEFVNEIPNSLKKHFIRGVLDADGSFCDYHTVDKGYNIYKINVQFNTYERLLEFIEKYFYDIGLSNTKMYKKYKRHNGVNKDGYCRTLTYTGKIQATNILNHLYKDSTMYLDRKYKKYEDILNK